MSADITPDGADAYVFTSSSHVGDDGVLTPTVTVSAPVANHGGNLRTAWWFEGQSPAVDQEACVTWTESSGPIAQAGVALRVRRINGRTQAVTVTNNIMWGARNGWNVHLWNGWMTGDLIGQAVLTRPFGTTVFTQPPLPWRLCARVVGTTLEFKAWSMATHPTDPRWSDPGFGTTFRLPRGWVYPGFGGWYVGHLKPGDSATYRHLVTGPLRVDPFDRLSLSVHTASDAVQRHAAADLATAVQSAV